MTMNSISFLGQNPYLKGTSPRKIKKEYSSKNNLKLVKTPKRQFKMYDLGKENLKSNYCLPEIEDDDYGLTFIDIEKEYEPIAPKNKPSYKHKKSHKTYPLQAILGLSALSSILSAGAVTLYLNSSEPEKVPEIKVIPFEEMIDNETEIEPEKEVEIEDINYIKTTPLEKIIDEDIYEDFKEDDTLKTSYNGAFDFKLTLSDENKKGLKKFMSIWNNPDKRQQYINVGNAIGIPPEIVAVNHYRESSGNFNCSQVDGTPLEETSFDNWADSAIHAYTNRGLNTKIIDYDDMNTWLKFLESYNGNGYKNANINTPYVWSGTEHYTSGKYISDGTYSASEVDKQPGCAIMLREIFIGDVLENDENKVQTVASNY